MCLSVCLSVCLSDCLSVCLSVLSTEPKQGCSERVEKGRSLTPFSIQLIHYEPKPFFIEIEHSLRMKLDRETSQPNFYWINSIYLNQIGPWLSFLAPCICICIVLSNLAREGVERREWWQLESSSGHRPCVSKQPIFNTTVESAQNGPPFLFFCVVFLCFFSCGIGRL